MATLAGPSQPVAGTPTQVGVGAVRRDAVQPGGELGVAAEALEPSVGPQVRLLHHVSRILLAAHQPIGEGVRLGMGGPNQLLERVVVAATGGTYPKLVRPCL